VDILIFKYLNTALLFSGPFSSIYSLDDVKNA